MARSSSADLLRAGPSAAALSKGAPTEPPASGDGLRAGACPGEAEAAAEFGRVEHVARRALGADDDRRASIRSRARLLRSADRPSDDEMREAIAADSGGGVIDGLADGIKEGIDSLFSK